jgi:hypothetical protein
MGRRRVAVILVAAAAAACTASPALRPVTPVPAARSAHLAVFGEAVLPATNARDKPRADVGGLSGAFYDESLHRLYAVADDRERPRVVVLDLAIEPKVTLTGREIVPLQSPIGARTLDAEGLAPSRDGNWLVSSEGDPAVAVQPVAGIHEYTRDGRFVRSLKLPHAYLGAVGDDSTGMRLNLSIEALSVSPDRNWLFAGMESSLLQDGPVGDFERGAVVRILKYDLRNTEVPPREYAYETDPMRRPADWLAADGDAGVVDVLALTPDDLLVLERGYIVEKAASPRRENTIRIYRVRLDRDAEVTGRASLSHQPATRVLQKSLVLDLATVTSDLGERLRGLENFEAMALGPRLADGSRTLLLLSDDNFSPGQVTALVVLRFL